MSWFFQHGLYSHYKEMLLLKMKEGCGHWVLVFTLSVFVKVTMVQTQMKLPAHTTTLMTSLSVFLL